MPRLTALLCLLAAALAGAAAAGTARAQDPIELGGLAALPPPDSLRADSLQADSTLALEDTLRPERYFWRRPEGLAARVRPRPTRGFLQPPTTQWQREVVLDSAAYVYTVRERLGRQAVREPVALDLDAYRAARLADDVDAGFRQLAAGRRDRRRRSGIGLTVDLPSGTGRAVETIFGSNEVDLRINGQADINLGVAYQNSEQREAFLGSGSSLDPTFGQNLNLGITGTIGDKMQVTVNYDTRSTFDFENQFRLVYTGYDDEILQRFEAGNVFLPAQTDLIRGGQRQFGIRTDLRFGGLGLTLVASQQDAETDALDLSGGTQVTPFRFNPASYDDNQHFFLGYYFRNRWEPAHAAPPTVVVGPGFGRITNIDVWIHDTETITTTGSEGENFTQAVALVDLAEPTGVVTDPDGYLETLGGTAPPPAPALDRYTDADLDQIRTVPGLDIGAQFGLGASDFADTRFRRLTEGQEYTFDPVLGTVTLTRQLADFEVLGVAYQYTDGAGSTVQVGDYGESTSSTDRRIVLKLLRDERPVPADASWTLTMRNVYRAGGRALSPAGFLFDLEYQPSGQAPQRTLPGVTITDGNGQALTLLQVLGLDRLNTAGTADPDDRFDFREAYTVNSETGRIFFPYLEPFGRTLVRVLNGQPVAEGGPTFNVDFLGVTQAQALASYAFPTLYDQKPVQARQNLTDLTNYRLVGEFSGGVQEFYNLGFALVPNSVRVTSGSIELTEGTDYVVEYATGTVTIRNPAYLASGSNIRIEYERNQFAQVQRKSLLGLRADYALGDDLALGATYLALTERPVTDKYRIGDEPIANAIWGVDGRFLAEPRWLTRVLDALPLIQTRAPSRVELRAEFAQLLPGSPETIAFRQARDALQDLGRDFADDEVRGISFIDDFEGTENAFSLLPPTDWKLAAPPAPAPAAGNGTLAEGSTAGPANVAVNPVGLPLTDPTLSGNWRARAAWYSLRDAFYRNGIVRDVTGSETGNAATRRITVQEVFPGREVEPTAGSDFLTTFDLYVDPDWRGPYNYNGQLGTAFDAQPRDAWAGIVQRLPEGFTDFDARNNIEFVEMIIRPYGGRDGELPVSPDAVLYVDLGQVSEEVLPDGRFSNEDGLLISDVGTDLFTPWARLPGSNAVQDNDLSYNEDTGRTEDLGYDGLPSEIAALAALDPYPVTETSFHDGSRLGLGQGSDFLTRLAGVRAAEAFIAREDPSADDYHHFEEVGYWENGDRFPQGATVQERFSRFYAGLELNGFQSQTQVARSGEPGNSRAPDSEDIDLSGSLGTVEAHFRYAIPLDPAALRSSPFFVNTIRNPNLPGAEDWYLIRIPVRTDLKEAVGPIQDFSRIESIRLWTEGHIRPATVRFAALDLVGSQWLKSDRVGIDDDGSASALEPELFVATINNEENRGRYAVPPGTLLNATATAGGQRLTQREQALLFRVEGLDDGQTRALYKPYTTPQDLTRYSNLRMFVHAEGFQRRDSMRVVVRLGSNETRDYYEYEQPIYPFDSERFQALGGSASPAAVDSLWQLNVPVNGTEIDLNEVNIDLSALNRLKVERDEAGVDPAVRYEGTQFLEGAPPGARIAITGNPSIQDVTTIVLGVRNGPDGLAVPIDTVEVWFNELRATGYDDESGWSAFGLAQVALADFAQINARVSRTTDGFGGLESTLGGRAFADASGYDVIANVSLHKLLPERYGWQAPLTLTARRNVTTPRYSPRRGDLRVDELLAQAQDDPNLTPEQQTARVDEILEQSQTVTAGRSLQFSLSKSGSGTDWLRYTVDRLQLSYNTTVSEGRSPSARLNDADQWNGAVTYNLTNIRPFTVRPLWLLEGKPVVGFLAGLRVNLLPTSFRVGARASRSISESRQRPSLLEEENPVRAFIPDGFLEPLRQTHVFGHTRDFDFVYRPLQFLGIRFGSNTQQSLDEAGADQTFDTIAFDADTEDTIRFDGLTRDEAELALQNQVANPEDYQLLSVRRLDILPATTVFGDLLGGDRRARTDSYSQTFTLTFDPRLDRVEWLRWLQVQPLSYTASYAWGYVPLTGLIDDTDFTLAKVSTNVSLRSDVTLRPVELFRLLPFYRRWEETQREADQEAQRRRAEREQARQAERERRRAEREAEEAAEEAGGDEAEGGEGPEDPGADGVSEGAELVPDPSRDLTDAEMNALTGGAEPEPEAPAPAAVEAEADSTGGGGFDPSALLRRLALAVTGVENVRVSYNGQFLSSSNAVAGTAYSFLDALGGEGPSMAYRFGLERTPGERARIGDPEVRQRIQPQDFFSDNHTVSGSSTLRLSEKLRVDFSFNVGWQDQQSADYDFDAQGNVTDPLRTRSGGATSTVIGVGGSYESFVEEVAGRVQAAIDADDDLTDGVQSDVLASNGVVASFRDAFIRSAGPFGTSGFLALPLPNWRITYTGAGDWPVIRSLTQQVQLRHGYSSTYQVGFRTDLNGGLETVTYDPAAAPFVSDAATFQAQTARVNEQFQPLIGADVTFRGGIQTRFDWNRSNGYVVTPASRAITRGQSNELSATLTYSKTGLRLPLFGSRLNNNLRLSFTFSRLTSLDRRLLLDQDLASVLAGGPISEGQPQGFTRLTVEPRISYTLSNQVTLDLFTRYESTDGQTSRNPTTSSFDGGFALRVSFSN